MAEWGVFRKPWKATWIPRNLAGVPMFFGRPELAYCQEILILVQVNSENCCDLFRKQLIRPWGTDLLATFCLFAAGTIGPEQGTTLGKQIREFSLQEFRGRSHSQEEHADAPVVVVYFMGPECPLANPDPARTIRWGQQTWDEMMIGYYDFGVPRKVTGKPTSSGRGTD